MIHGCDTSTIPYTILHYHNVYGPRMGDAHVIPDFLIRAKGGTLSFYLNSVRLDASLIERNANMALSTG